MRALVLVDIQNDFLPGGALAVPQGDEVVPIANRLLASFEIAVATQDWHPADHLSFAAQHAGSSVGQVVQVAGLDQILWPVHCVQGTDGAEFAGELDVGRLDAVFPKGTERDVDSYSGFFDNGRRHATGLEEWLRERAVGEVWIAGLATDYCVRWTALDALSLGFRTRLVLDGCRGVELTRGDVDRAVDEMRAAGVEVVRASDASV